MSKTDNLNFLKIDILLASIFRDFQSLVAIKCAAHGNNGKHTTIVGDVLVGAVMGKDQVFQHKHKKF